MPTEDTENVRLVNVLTGRPVATGPAGPGWRE
jgi:hypothetical protein